MINAYKISVGNLKKRGQLRNQGVDGAASNGVKVVGSEM
jgi:hypothetical protein